MLIVDRLGASINYGHPKNRAFSGRVDMYALLRSIIRLAPGQSRRHRSNCHCPDKNQNSSHLPKPPSGMLGTRERLREPSSSSLEMFSLTRTITCATPHPIHSTL